MCVMSSALWGTVVGAVFGGAPTDRYGRRTRYNAVEIDTDWDELYIDYIYEEDLIETLLWYGSNLVVISPKSIRDQITNRASELIHV